MHSAASYSSVILCLPRTRSGVFLPQSTRLTNAVSARPLVATLRTTAYCHDHTYYNLCCHRMSQQLVSCHVFTCPAVEQQVIYKTNATHPLGPNARMSDAEASFGRLFRAPRVRRGAPLQVATMDTLQDEWTNEPTTNEPRSQRATQPTKKPTNPPTDHTMSAAGPMARQATTNMMANRGRNRVTETCRWHPLMLANSKGIPLGYILGKVGAH